MRLLIDTGPFMALHNKRDKQHSDAVESFDKIRDGKTSYRKLYTSDYVLDEAVTGCRRRTRNHELSVALGTLILSSESMLILRVDENTFLEAWELYKSRREIPLSLTDCTSAILARKQGITDMYSYDSDFEALGFRVLGHL
ncbi:type II toxin-antitoxin system VapC family toxin [Candidatus Bathyarchaeota archaeon]|nr:MAG: type II toxin-antitoxin system VapC family toxin [Candidatus Bathyarchaeota archaeon]